MIFDKLFLQYQEGRRPCFGSRFMNTHGRWLIGLPANLMKNIQLRKDLEQSFYFTRSDRHPPEDKAELSQWKVQSIYATQLREGRAPGKVAKAQYPVALALASLLYIAGFAVSQGEVFVMNVEHSFQAFYRIHIGGQDAILKADISTLTLGDCDALSEAVKAKKLTMEQLTPGFDDKCRELRMNAQMQEEQKAHKGGSQ